jgi:hypothetical protein
LLRTLIILRYFSAVRPIQGFKGAGAQAAENSKAVIIRANVGRVESYEPIRSQAAM